MRYFYYRFIRLHSDPTYIARGLAVGLFSGYLPLFGLQIVIAIALASVFRGHRVVAAASTWISNPLTYIPLYSLGFHVGKWVLNNETQSFSTQTFLSTQAMLDLGGQFVGTLFLGCALLGLVLSVLGYWGSRYLLHRAHRKRLRRRLHKKFIEQD